MTSVTFHWFLNWFPTLHLDQCLTSRVVRWYEYSWRETSNKKIVEGRICVMHSLMESRKPNMTYWKVFWEQDNAFHCTIYKHVTNNWNGDTLLQIIKSCLEYWPPYRLSHNIIGLSPSLTLSITTLMSSSIWHILPFLSIVNCPL
jgi:hypothetical protein